MTGESIVEQKIQRLDAAVSANYVKHSEHPGRAQREFEELYRQAITIEAEPSAKQAEEQMRRSNQSFFERVKQQTQHG
jgi:hypothetical protein